MKQTSELKIDQRIKKHTELCAAALALNGGDRSFKQWKAASLAEVVEQANRSPRMELLSVSLHGDMNIVYRIAMPVPRWPSGNELVIGESAVFHLTYRDQWRTEPPAGWEPVGLLEPIDIFHANSRPALKGALCLGRLPAGIAPTELILLGYYLVSLQDYTLDEQDPDGVLNPQACEWYRCHSQYLPLTRAGLFDPWTPEELEHVRRS
jgi:hypothetical protein